jgi:hypothetical protein
LLLCLCFGFNWLHSNFFFFFLMSIVFLLGM